LSSQLKLRARPQDNCKGTTSEGEASDNQIVVYITAITLGSWAMYARTCALFEFEVSNNSVAADVTMSSMHTTGKISPSLVGRLGC